MRRQGRLPFELDQRSEVGAVTAHGGVPLVIEAIRTSGPATVLDEAVVIKRRKQRKRGLPPSQLVEGLFSLWPCGAVGTPHATGPAAMAATTSPRSGRVRMRPPLM